MKRLLVIPLVTAASLAFAETLVVNSGNSPLTLSSAAATTNSYDSVEVNGVLNVNDSVTLDVAKAAGYLDIGTQAGVDAVVNFNGDPKVTRFWHPGASGNRFNIRIGAASNGGSGKITATGTETTVPLPIKYMYNVWNGYGHLTLRYQNLTVMAGAAANGRLSDDSAANDVVDALELNPGGMAGISSMYNKSAFPARILFKGGAIVYNNCWEGDGFYADTGTKWILESVGGNPISLHTIWGTRTLNSYGRALETRGTGDVILTAAGDDVKGNTFSVSSGILWNHSGDIVIGETARFIAAADNVSPCGTGRGGVVIRADTQPGNAARSAYYNPNGRKQYLNSLEIVGKGGWVTNGSATTATLVFGTNDLNGTFRVPRIGGPLALTKMGAGTLTVTNTPSVPPLAATAGNVEICRADAGNVTIPSIAFSAAGKVTVRTATTVNAMTAPNAGAELIVDGACLTVAQMLPKLLTLTLRNGGSVTYAFAPGADVTSRLLPAADAATASDVVKTGAGDLQLDAAGGFLRSLDIAAGTVRLGRVGTDNRFWRATYKQAMTAGQQLYMGPLRLFDKNCDFADGGAPANKGTTTVYANKTGTVADPSQLAAQEFICSSTDYLPNASPKSGHEIVGPVGQFYCSTVFSCCFTNPVPKIDDSSTWITMTWRIPDAAAVGYPCAYDLRSQWEGQGSKRPGAWKLESSPTGLDGSWMTMDEKSGVNGKWGQSWYNGQNNGEKSVSANPWQIPAAFGASATPLASVGTLKVASGATLDASLVTGGQELAALAVDAADAGTLVNVRLAATGTIDVLNAVRGAVIPLPLAFVDSVTTGSLDGWTVRFDGVEKPGYHLMWQNGRLAVFGPGMMLIVR